MYRITAKSISTGKTHASKWYPSIQEMADLKQKLHENEDIADVAVENDSADSITTKIGEIEEMANEMIAASADDDSFFTAEEKTMIDNLHEAIQAVYDSVMDRAEVDGEVDEAALKPGMTSMGSRLTPEQKKKRAEMEKREKQIRKEEGPEAAKAYTKSMTGGDAHYALTAPRTH